MNSGTKSAFASKGVWGGVIAVAAAGAGFLGYTVSGEDTASLTEAAIQIAGAVGGVIAIIGRITANTKIG